MLLSDAALRAEAADLLQDMAPQVPGADRRHGCGSDVLTGIGSTGQYFLYSLAAADDRSGGGALAGAIRVETPKVDLLPLAGMSLDQAWTEANRRLGDSSGGSRDPDPGDTTSLR